jgi:AraC-like DNA-binding protein
MDTCYTTEDVGRLDRSRYWQQTISNAYFPLSLSFRRPEDFCGAIDIWGLGAVSVSRIRANGTVYTRHARHLRDDSEETFLITVPDNAPIRFVQGGADVICDPGTLVVERSHLPYEFIDPEINTLWVLRVPASLMRQRLSLPDQFGSARFDCRKGAGRLFADMMRLVPETIDDISLAGRGVVGRQLIDLLALTLSGGERVLESVETSVRQAHFRRIEQFVRRNLTMEDLSPQAIAAASGISVRYLHQLFHEKGTSIGRWVREQRLRNCDEALRDPGSRRTIAEIAYSWGFSDQSKFSRHYKACFGHTPSEARLEARRRHKYPEH